MANSSQAKKRARQAEKRRCHNASKRSEMRTYIKNVLKAIDAGDKTLANTLYQKAMSTIDKLAAKGLIHQNKASRHKSRLCSKVKSM